MTAPRIVGLDLSLTRTGVADADGRVDVIKLAQYRDAERLSVAHYTISAAVTGANLVIIEGYAYNSANAAHSLGELGGVIRLMLYQRRIPYLVVPPATLKKYATGKGNVGKGAVMVAASTRLHYDLEDDNEADALWLRAIGMDLAGYPMAQMPAINSDCLRALRMVFANTMGTGS